MGSNLDTFQNQDRKQKFWSGGAAAAAEAAAKESFRILTTVLLGLLLPLSFLLLARLATARYLLSVTENYPLPCPSSVLCSVFLHTNMATILHLLVSVVSVSALTYGLTGKITFLSTQSSTATIRPRLYAAWIFLCTLQVCVGLGVEGSISAGIVGSGFGQGRSLIGRAIFFLGLHETMFFWSKMVVKPVVEDTVFGFPQEDKWVDKVFMAFSCGTLWWWRIRDEVEALVVVPEVKRELLMGVAAADFFGWWLYYLTVTIGMVRVVKGVIWVVMIIICWRRDGGDSGQSRPRENDEKV